MTYNKIIYLLTHTLMNFGNLMDFNTQGQYLDRIRPERAPETRVFGTVWSILYTIMAIVLIALIVEVIRKKLPAKLFWPFGLNLLFNMIFTYIQFGLANFQLAFVDIVLVLLTIVRSMVAVWKYRKWMSIAYIPYLVWVCIATVLQYQVMMLNS